MSENVKVLMEKYQVRRSFHEKEVFAVWLESKLKELGYSFRHESYHKKGINLIVGDPETAEFIMTAHYDTPTNSFFPLITLVSGPVAFIVSQIWNLLPFLILFRLETFSFNSAIGSLVNLVAAILGMLYLYQVVGGISNKNNANDNTSGIAVLLNMLENLPIEERSKVCVVFFDQEEDGLVGSRSFKKKYKDEIADKPVINFDCVGNGDYIIFSSKKAFRSSRLNDLMKEVVEVEFQSKRKPVFEKASKIIFFSDQIIFKNSIGIFSAKRNKLFGFYINQIHSKSDKTLDFENINLLSTSMINFVSQS